MNTPTTPRLRCESSDGRRGRDVGGDRAFVPSRGSAHAVPLRHGSLARPPRSFPSSLPVPESTVATGTAGGIGSRTNPTAAWGGGLPAARGVSVTCTLAGRALHPLRVDCTHQRPGGVPASTGRWCLRGGWAWWARGGKGSWLLIEHLRWAAAVTTACCDSTIRGGCIIACRDTSAMWLC